MSSLDPENERRPAVAQLSRFIDAANESKQALKFALRNSVAMAKDAMRAAALAKPGDEKTNQNLFDDATSFHDNATLMAKGVADHASKLNELALGATSALRRYLVSLAPPQVQEKFQSQIANPDNIEPQAHDGHKPTQDRPGD